MNLLLKVIMKIVFIGSGNVATHLSMALQRSGNDIIQVFSKTISNAQTLAEKISGISENDCLATNCLSDICPDADTYIFSIKDDALKDTAVSIGNIMDSRNPLFIHTAGSVPMDVFKGIAKRYGVLYPMQTFSKTRQVDFSSIPCFIEASDKTTLDIINDLASSISSRVEEASSEKRKKMHLAAVFACNLTNHCYRLAERIVNAEGFDFNLFQPLIEETARKVGEMSPRDAQTGPMVRGDKTIMSAQIQLISDDLTRQIYSLMAESIYRDTHEGMK